MKIYHLLFMLFIFQSFSIKSMEEQNKEQQEEEVIEKTSIPAKVPSLARLVSKKILGSLADKAIEIYDKTKSQNPNKAYKAFSQYLNNLEESKKLSQALFDDFMHSHIIFDLGRVDIFGSELLRLYLHNPTPISMIFFNNFNFDEKAAIAKWLVLQIYDLRYFDINLIEGIVDLLETIFKNYKNLHFYDLVLEFINEKMKQMSDFKFIPDISAGEKKILGGVWNDQMQLIISLTYPQGESIDKELYAEVGALIKKFQNEYIYKAKKIIPIINYLKKIISDVIARTIEQENSKFRLPSLETDKELEHIFEMLLNQNPETAKIIYYKNLEEFLPTHLKYISTVKHSVIKIFIDKLIKLLQYNEDFELLDNQIVNLLGNYYSRFGLNFINEALTNLIDSLKELEPQTQQAVLNNLQRIIVKFAEQYGINEEQFYSKLALIKEKLRIFRENKK